MTDYKSEFINSAIACGALQFGSFTLKSGRVSPYFFNAGKFYTGTALAVLGRCYAAKIVESGVEFDLLFGPAYKGITLAAATAIALSEQHGIDVPYCFNRKEKKDHGEGGNLVGAPLKGRVLIVDDVITAGTAIREVMGIIMEAGAAPSGVIIGLDRQEKGKSGTSAICEVEHQFSIFVKSIINLDDIVGYLDGSADRVAISAAIAEYRREFGI